MKEIYKALTAPLTIEEIDFRVQSVNNGGYATLLAYKDARVDINRLNKHVGMGNWKRSHKEIKGAIYCTVSIFNQDIQEWVSVQDVGYCAQNSYDPGIAIKGEASDSFKRACFNLGIGIELYDYPLISIPLEKHEWLKGDGKQKNKTTWQFNLKQWFWGNEFGHDSKLTRLWVNDTTGKNRFNWRVTE